MSSTKFNYTIQLGGLDILRILALLFVVVQHALTLTENDQWTNFHRVNIGQLGVAIFLGISGLLSSVSSRPPLSWLKQRCQRIYPAYWLVLLVSFAMTWVVGYKSFGLYQFVSQMAGTGLFTHPNNLVNVPTWFISILLLCYMILFIGRTTKQPLIANLFILMGLYICIIPLKNPWPWMHLITFFQASSIVLAIRPVYWSIGFIVLGAISLLLSTYSVALLCTGISLALIGIVLLLPLAPHWITKLAEPSYEYYLVHGLCLFVSVYLLREYALLAVLLGLLLAIPVTWGLRKTTFRLTQLFAIQGSTSTRQ